MGNKKSLSLLNSLAIMSTFIFGCGAMMINPVIQKLAEAYPTVSIPTIKMASTLVALISSVVMIIVGGVVGKKLKYKSVMLFAMICFLVGGLLPMVWNSSYTYVLISRAIFGIGMGCIGCRNGLVMASYDDNSKAKILGYGVFIANACGVLLQTLCGFLADKGLKLSYLIYLAAVIPLVLVLVGLKEPEPLSTPSSTEEETKTNTKQKEGLAPRVWLYVAMGLVWCIIGYSMMTNMSTFIKMKGFGEAGISGTILSLYMLGGAIGGSISAKWLNAAKRFFVPMTFFIAAIGEALVLSAINIPVMAIGATLAGFPWFALMPNLMYFSGLTAGKKSTPMATSLVLAATQAGVFISSYFCELIGKITGEAVINTKIAAIVGFVALSILFLIIDVRPEQVKMKKSA